MRGHQTSIFHRIFPKVNGWKLLLVLAFGLPSISASADIVTVQNAGFEDTTGQTVFNEFTFGTPAGWTMHDPNGILGPGVFTGTLQPNGVDFFSGPAPEGDRVAILFNSGREGDGEYGFEQTLTETLQADTVYQLSVDVGNIASGVASDGTFFNLDEFPGYRIDLLAGGVVIAQDNNSLVIPEAEFATSTIEFSVDAAHAQIGQALGIRLVNLNQIPGGFTQMTSPDLEVDFDNVRFTATAVPEPGHAACLIGLVSLLALRRRRKMPL